MARDHASPGIPSVLKGWAMVPRRDLLLLHRMKSKVYYYYLNNKLRVLVVIRQLYGLIALIFTYHIF